MVKLITVPNCCDLMDKNSSEADLQRLFIERFLFGVFLHDHITLYWIILLQDSQIKMPVSVVCELPREFDYNMNITYKH